MTTDRATLEYFGMVPGRSRAGRCVLELVDHVVSARGRQVLRQRFEQPPASLADVLTRQAAHRAMTPHLDAYRAVLSGASIDQVERYFALAWLLPSQMPRLARLRPWHRAYRADIRAGYAACQSLVAAATALLDLPPARDPAMHALSNSLERLLHSEAAAAIGRRPAPSVTVAELTAFDECCRGAHRAEVVDLIACVAECEALYALAEATRRQAWTYPSFGARLSVRGLTHPLLDESAVRNDLHGDGRRVFFVTGPNMAGKSTFIRAIGIAMLLAHAGAGVPADAMDTPFFDGFFANGQATDDMASGESLYLAEVRRIGALGRLAAARRRTFAVLDEPLRGTNVHDARDAVHAILERLVAHETLTTVVATHLAEVGSNFADDPRLVPLHFEADCSSGAPRFTYRLKDGCSTQRLGMLLLEREGVLPLLD